MISAYAENRVIGGKNGGIPWHLPRDSTHFCGYTQNKYMLLGRRTYSEMTGWFTTQKPIVLTRNGSFANGDVLVAASVPDAIELAKAKGAEELVVSGGASVYAAALPFAERLVLTRIEANIPGGAHFPDYQASGGWETVSSEHFPADAENAYAMTFVELSRVHAKVMVKK